MSQVSADWLSSESGPLALHVSTNNDAVIASIVVFDPDGGLFSGEVRTIGAPGSHDSLGGKRLKSTHSSRYSMPADFAQRRSQHF